MKTHYIVDTNVLMRYLLKDDELQYQSVAPYFLSDKHLLVIPIHVLCEVVWLLTKSMKLKKSLVLGIILSLTEADNVIVDQSLVQAGIDFMKYGGDFADGIIAHEVNRHDNASLLTFDKNAQKIARQLNISVVEPKNGS